jgi:hypothetical protein
MISMRAGSGDTCQPLAAEVAGTAAVAAPFWPADWCERLARCAVDDEAADPAGRAGGAGTSQ